MRVLINLNNRTCYCRKEDGNTWLVVELDHFRPVSLKKALFWLDVNPTEVDEITIHACKENVTDWPTDCTPKKVSIVANNCPVQVFSPRLSLLQLFIKEPIPLGIPRVTLEFFQLKTDHLPSWHHFIPIEAQVRLVEHKTWEDVPVWVLKNNVEDYLGPFEYLYLREGLFFMRFVVQGLQVEGRWKQWLTKGLYDPRLLIQIVSFMIAWSDIISKSS